jgi:GNAT superfamily N-acetyltransferase
MNTELPPEPARPGYRVDLEQWVAWNGGAIHVRPIRSDDYEQQRSFFYALSAADLQPRTLSQLPSVQVGQLARLTWIDYEREMTFIALLNDETPGRAVGLVRSAVDAGNERAEFALALRPDMKGRGLGRILLGKLIAYYRARRTQELVGEARADDARMIELARAFWFEVRTDPESGAVTLRLTLGPSVAAG